MRSMVPAAAIIGSPDSSNVTRAIPSLIIMRLWGTIGGTQMIIFLAGLQQIPDMYYEAARIDGANLWQLFWRITLPSIRWGLTYGIVLTIARTLGEFGAVIMVSSNLPGKSQTLTLLVADRYNRGNEYGAYAVSTVLMAVAVLVLIVQVVLDARRARAAK